MLASARRDGLRSGDSGGGSSGVGIVEHIHVAVEDIVQDVKEIVGSAVPLGILGGYDGLLLADEVADDNCRLGGGEVGDGRRRRGCLVEAGHGVEVGLGVGIRRGTGAVALDLGPLDVLSEEGAALEEELVVVGAGVRSTGEPLEAVQIQLTLEAGEFALVEKLGHNDVGEFLRLVDDEGPAVGLPAHDVGETLSLDAAEHVVQADGEGRFDSASGDVRDDTGRISGVVMIGMDDATALVLATCAVGSFGRGTGGDHGRGYMLRRWEFHCCYGCYCCSLCSCWSSRAYGATAGGGAGGDHRRCGFEELKRCKTLGGKGDTSSSAAGNTHDLMFDLLIDLGWLGKFDWLVR